jgi:hypothetical protein
MKARGDDDLIYSFSLVAGLIAWTDRFDHLVVAKLTHQMLPM